MFRQVTEHSELETLLFIFLAAFYLFSKLFQQFDDVQTLRHKALVCVWIRVDLFCLTDFGENDRNDCEELRWFRYAWRESHTWILVIVTVLKKKV